MKKLALAAVVLAALAFPAIAAAKSIKLSGGVVKDPDSSVSLKVVVKDGQPQKLKAFRAENINVRCNGEFGNLPGFTISGSIPVKSEGSFKVRLPNVNDPSEKLRVSGKVKKDGKVVSGNFKTNKLTIGNEVCDMPKQHFELEK